MKRFITSLFILTLLAISVAAGSWHADTLGQGFMMRQFDQGRDYSGPVVSTLVRLEPDSATDRAVLYIHGFNDYFFQTEMARKFVDHGYTFYAVDLRKYGRSLLPGQKRCQVRSFDEYTADLDSAFAVIGAEGHSHIVLMGHSTGGLVASYYLERHPRPEVCAVILNSPFLDWNLGKMECLVGGVAFLGRIFPNIAFSSGSSTAYGESLDADCHGRWHFNHQWKALGGTKVDLGWVKAISQAQRYMGRDTSSGGLLQRGKNAMKVFSVLVTWSLESAIDTADSMRSRGYGQPGRTAFSIYRLDDRDRSLLLWLGFCGLYLLTGVVSRGLYFQYYPLLLGAPAQPLTISFFAVYLLLCLTPSAMSWVSRRRFRRCMKGGA